MSKFVHLVYIHTTEDGLIDDNDIVGEREFDTRYLAEFWIEEFNKAAGDNPIKAVYYGCVSDEPGESA
jgi:hypothetical protein